MTSFLADLRHVLDQELFKIKGTPISVSTLIAIGIVVMLTFWLSSAMSGLVRRRLVPKHPALSGVATLVRYFVLLIGFGIAVSTAGIDLTALFAAGAVFAAALGFAMQNVVQNFVAGIILLTERSIKPGDVLEIDKLMVKVVDMGIRASIVKSRDGEDLIVPNSILVQNIVKNFTLRDPNYSVNTTVGVSYESDMDKVKDALLEACNGLTDNYRVPERKPQVVMQSFGDSAVVFKVSVWVPEAWVAPQATAQLNERIWQILKARKISMAYPQLDVHFDPPVLAALDRSVGRP